MARALGVCLPVFCVECIATLEKHTNTHHRIHRMHAGRIRTRGRRGAGTSPRAPRARAGPPAPHRPVRSVVKMVDQRVHVDVEELLARGFTVIRDFLDAETCRRARAVIDETLGAPDDDLVPLRSHPPSDSIHEIAHPNPALAVMAPFMPKLADATAQVLRSSIEHLRLNGQTLLRTDPSAGGTPGSPSTIVHWHVDNAFLDTHMDSTPRQVYSRAMVTLSNVHSGGGAIMVAPNSVGVTRTIIRELVASKGAAAYHGAQWRAEIAERLTADTKCGKATLLQEQKGVVGTEVLTNAGDLIIFDPMCTFPIQYTLPVSVCLCVV